MSALQALSGRDIWLEADGVSSLVELEALTSISSTISMGWVSAENGGIVSFGNGPLLAEMLLIESDRGWSEWREYHTPTLVGMKGGRYQIQTWSVSGAGSGEWITGNFVQLEPLQESVEVELPSGQWHRVVPAPPETEPDQPVFIGIEMHRQAGSLHLRWLTEHEGFVLEWHDGPESGKGWCRVEATVQRQGDWNVVVVAAEALKRFFRLARLPSDH